MDDITTRLIAEADEELRAEIEAAAKPLDNLLRDGSCGVNIKAKRHCRGEGAGTEFDTGGAWYELLAALREDAFRKHAVARREKKVAGFMGAVHAMQAELDSLKARIGE